MNQECDSIQNTSYEERHNINNKKNQPVRDLRQNIEDIFFQCQYHSCTSLLLRSISQNKSLTVKDIFSFHLQIYVWIQKHYF